MQPPVIEIGAAAAELRRLTTAEQERITDALENGAVLYLPRLTFHLDDTQVACLDPRLLAARSKNISWDAVDGRVQGARDTSAVQSQLAELLGGFHAFARDWLDQLLPAYRSHLIGARSSLRPVEVRGRRASWKSDDTRLHIDAFPTRPTGGARILRFFCNVSPAAPRVWHLGEPFEAVAQRFLPQLRRMLPGAQRLAYWLGVTQSLRSAYDHSMRQLHDCMKADSAYQHTAVRTEVAFQAGSTWICFSDQVSHAAIAGQHMLEQTLLLPVGAQRNPEKSPLRVLERLMGKRLTG